MSTRPAANPASADDVLLVVGPVERVVSARSRPGDDVDEIVQETVARVLEARWRLDREALIAYAIVTARNLVTERHRGLLVHQRNRHRLAEPPDEPSPEAEVLLREEQEAMRTAMARLSSDDHELLLAHEVRGQTVGKIAADAGVTPNTLAARLSRARARLRLEHLLAFRRVALPTPRCRGILEAVSLGDRRRQHALAAGAHLLECPTCADLSESLLHRRRGLAAVWPLPLLWALPRRVHRSLGTAATAAAAAVLAVTVGTTALLVPRHSSPPVPKVPPAAPRAAARAGPTSATVGAASFLRISGVAFPPGSPTLHDHVGATARIVSARVQSVPADEGFWVGTGPGRRVWVQLQGRGESPQRIAPGALVTLSGTIRAADATVARQIGLDRAEGSAEFVRTGAYVAANRADLQVVR